MNGTLLYNIIMKFKNVIHKYKSHFHKKIILKIFFSNLIANTNKISTILTFYYIIALELYKRSLSNI